MKQGYVIFFAICFAWIGLFGCGDGDGRSTPDSAAGGETGTLTVSLTDTPAGDLKAVYVTIDEVSVCMEASAAEEDDGAALQAAGDGCQWEVIAAPDATYNLLELVNGVTETLGVAELPAGTYHQLRLMIGAETGDAPDRGFNLLGEEHPAPNYLIDANGSIQPLSIPSGVQQGIKLVRTFEIEENQYAELILDFDAQRSVIRAGQKRPYILKPTIKVMDTRQMVKLAGVVSEIKDSNAVPLEAVTVMAQRTEDLAGPMVEASTLTDESGGYQLLLEKNTEYKLVVFAEEYVPACDWVHTYDDAIDIPKDVILEAADSKEIAIIISGAAEGADVSLSLRKEGLSCGNGNQEIELLGEAVSIGADDYVYSVSLPLGEGYKVVCLDGANKVSAVFAVEKETESLTVRFEP